MTCTAYYSEEPIGGVCDEGLFYGTSRSGAPAKRGSDRIVRCPSFPISGKCLHSLSNCDSQLQHKRLEDFCLTLISEDFDVAEELFEQIFREDPHRLEGLDVYSNILYVKENKAKLSFLAHRASETDKYRAETCCIVGKRRSTRWLDWILLRELLQHQIRPWEGGSVFWKVRRAWCWFIVQSSQVESKLSGGLDANGTWIRGIEEYARSCGSIPKGSRFHVSISVIDCLEINPRDYRAWYGLGQTYEILKMHLYSLYYYNKATALRFVRRRSNSEEKSDHTTHVCGVPWGLAMSSWVELKRPSDVLKGRQITKTEKVKWPWKIPETCRDCPWPPRSAVSKDRRWRQVCLLFPKEFADQRTRRGKHHSSGRVTNTQVEGPETIDAILFLGNYYKDKGEFSEAETYATRLLDYSGKPKDDGKALLKELVSLRKRNPQQLDAVSLSVHSLDMSIE